MLPLMEEFGVELIEQPFKADDLDAFRVLRDRSSIPIVADESCRVAEDVPRLAGAVDGVNIKLEKCGSLREAVRIVHVARAHHLQVMIGCMLCTTLGIAAGFFGGRTDLFVTYVTTVRLSMPVILVAPLVAMLATGLLTRSRLPIERRLI